MKPTAGLSKSPEKVENIEDVEDMEYMEEESVHSDISKQRMKNALIYYEQLLGENDLVASASSSVINSEAMLMREELYHYTPWKCWAKKNL